MIAVTGLTHVESLNENEVIPTDVESGMMDDTAPYCPVDYSSPPPSGCIFLPNANGGYDVICP